MWFFSLHHLSFIVLFAAEIFLSMDTSSGSPTLDERLMSTLNCGNFSSSTGCSNPLGTVQTFCWYVCQFISTNLHTLADAVIPWLISVFVQCCLSCICWQTSSGQSVWLEEMADWGSCFQNWTALLPLLVSQTISTELLFNTCLF